MMEMKSPELEKVVFPVLKSAQRKLFLGHGKTLYQVRTCNVQLEIAPNN